MRCNAGQTADDLQVAQLLGPDVHEKIFSRGVFAVEPLDRILHRRGELAVGATELLQQHVAEARVRLVHADGVHELLYVVIHSALFHGLSVKATSGRMPMF